MAFYNLIAIDRIDYTENLPSLEINMNKIRELEQELESIYDNISKEAQIRSKAKWTKY